MAVPTLALIPAAQGSKLYSVLPSNGVGDFDFTRASTATRINSKGLIEEVASGVSRLDYTGGGCPHHLLEPQSTNLVAHSEDFSQPYWSKVASTITSNVAISPYGTLNADKLVEDTQNAAHITFTSPNVTLGNNTFSVFAKAAERRVLGIEFPSNGILVSFDLIDGVFVNSQANPDNFSITPFSNGWYRIDIIENLTSTSTVALSLRDENGNRAYQGDGTSGVYIFGAQVEQGSYATSYIPNFGTALGVTRLAETANNAGDADTFNDSEGVLFLNLSALVEGVGNRDISISDGTLNNYISIFYRASIKTVWYQMVSGGATQISIQLNDVNQTDINKIALTYRQNEAKIYINGILKGIDTSTINTPVGLSTLAFDAASIEPFYGKTKKLEYYNTALTSLEIETLTSYTSFNEMALNFNYTI